MWDPSTGEYLEQENCMTDHQAQIIVPATMATKWVFIIAVISYSLAHDTIIVIDADTYSTALVFRILVSVVVIFGQERISLQKVQKMIQVTTQREVRTMHNP